MIPAFKCKNCGHLEPAGHAGERAIPLACSVCCCGVEFTKQGIKMFKPENWIILAGCTTEELTAFGISEYEKHVPFAKGENREPKNISLTASESTGTSSQSVGVV